MTQFPTWLALGGAALLVIGCFLTDPNPRRRHVLIDIGVAAVLTAAVIAAIVNWGGQ